MPLFLLRLGPMVRLLLLVGLLGLSACTSALKVVTGTYSYYDVTEDEVLYLTWNPMSQRYHVSRLEGADPASFTRLTQDYGRDRTQVFRGALPIAHADPATFTLYGSGYAADATQVFFNRTRLEGAHPETFQRLQDGWSRDRDHIYVGPVRLDICDIDSFVILSRWRAKDDHCYYAEATRVDISDRASLQILPAFYAKDRVRVYWQDQVVVEADAGSFEVKDASSFSIARDAFQCFSGPRRLACEELNEEGRAFCRCDERGTRARSVDLRTQSEPEE